MLSPKIKAISEAFSTQPRYIEITKQEHLVNTPKSRYHKFIKEIKSEMISISNNEYQEYFICYDFNGNISSQFVAKAMHIYYYYEEI